MQNFSLKTPISRKFILKIEMLSSHNFRCPKFATRPICHNSVRIFFVSVGKFQFFYPPAFLIHDADVGERSSFFSFFHSPLSSLFFTCILSFSPSCFAPPPIPALEAGSGLSHPGTFLKSYIAVAELIGYRIKLPNKLMTTMTEYFLI